MVCLSCRNTPSSQGNPITNAHTGCLAITRILVLGLPSLGSPKRPVCFLFGYFFAWIRLLDVKVWLVCSPLFNCCVANLKVKLEVIELALEAGKLGSDGGLCCLSALQEIDEPAQILFPRMAA